MGLGTSRMGRAPPHGPGPLRRRRLSAKRRISSFLICGGAASTSREMENCPAELVVNSAELHDGEKLNHEGNGVDVSLSSWAALSDIRTENQVSSAGPSSSNVEPGDEGKWLSESRELVPCQSTVIASVNGTASTSSLNPPLSNCVCATEIVNLDTVKDMNRSMTADSETFEAPSNSNSLPFYGIREDFFDEASVENNIAEAPDFSDSEYGSFSVASDSSIDFHLMGDDSLQEVIPSAVGFLVSESEQNREERDQSQGDVMGVSSNTLSSNSAERRVFDTRRNTPRLFWDAFSTPSPGGDLVSRGLLFSSNESDYLRSQDRMLLDFDGDFLSNDRRGDVGSHRSTIQGINEQRWSSRSEIWGRFREGLDSTDRTSVCPRRIHADGSCSCQSGLPTEESGSHAISRLVLLAQSLFEVLDHMHRPPISISMSMVSLPAAEPVIDSFPVKIHEKENVLECAEDVAQCYICLADYEEGDKIRVLPCLHEYHMSCVDKWLKEIHGVCPLCRRDVCGGSTGAPVSD